MYQRIERHGKKWRVTWQRAGQRFRRSFETETEARHFAAELEAEEERLRRAAAARAAQLSVGEVVASYYEVRKRRLQASTQAHYEQVIAKHIVPKIGSLSARELADNPAPLQDFYDSLPPTTALHAHQILRPAFQYVVDHRRLDRNPCSVVKPPRKRKRGRLIPLPEEVQKIIAAAVEMAELFGLFVWLVARLGLRRGEASALRWEDFDFGRRTVHIRRTIARRKGGTYIKPPKSGEERSLRMSRRFFDHLEPYRRPSGWLFPRAYNCPYDGGGGVSPQSTAGRLLRWLSERGGSLSCPEGRAGTKAALAIGLGRYSAAPTLRWLDEHRYIERAMKPRHIYRIALTPEGSAAVESWNDVPPDGLPWFPTTADQHFAKLMRQLDLPYRLHDLRHFVATHLYNRKRDWVQLARFLGHTNPALTMSLYANHVVEVSQIELGEAAMDLFDEADIVEDEQDASGDEPPRE